LKVNTTIKFLTLTSNSIGDDGAKLLAEALKQNKTITHLKIGYCSIKSDGGKLIASSIDWSRTVINVDIYGNPLGDSEQLIHDAADRNSRLKG